MRSSVFAGGNITYPDRIVFAYNPNYIILDNMLNDETAKILFVNQGTQKEFEINVSMVKGHAEVYISKFLRLLFGVRDQERRYVSLLVIVTVRGIQQVIDLSCIYGSLNIGERFGQIGSFAYDEKEGFFTRRVRWFKNYPFKVSIFSNSVSSVYHYRSDDRTYYGTKDLSIGYIDVDPNSVVPDARRFAVFKVVPDGSDGMAQSTFDSSFDYTFNNLASSVSLIRLIVDESKCGHYFRWVDPMGQLQYFLFAKGEEQMKVTESESFEEDVESEGMYFGVVKRVLEKTRTRELKCCAVNLTTDEQEYVKTIVSSIDCQMYIGKRNGNDLWMPVNVKAGTFSTSEIENLQDFEVSVELPISQTQTR